jgi:hypothetical protein
MAIKDYLSKQEWQAQRLANEVARGIIKATPNVKAFIDAHSPSPLSQNQARLDALNKSIATNRAAMDKLTRDNKKRHVPKARRWDGIPGGSDCFSDASYDGHGNLTLDFIGPKSGTYSYDVDDDEARAARRAAREGRLGEWFKENIR